MTIYENKVPLHSVAQEGIQINTTYNTILHVKSLGYTAPLTYWYFQNTEPNVI